jgi:hypothetical protein
MRNFLQPEELMRNYIRFKLHTATSKPLWSTPLKDLWPKLLGPFSQNTATIRKIYPTSLICLALLLFGIATSLRAQDEPKQDEPQQQGEPKQDKEQGKNEDTKSDKKEEKQKKGEPTPRLPAMIWHQTVDVVS